MLKHPLAGVRAAQAADSAARNLWGTSGPKVSAVGVPPVTVGMLFQGKFGEINHTDVELALLALGILGTRANKVSSERAGAK